MLSLAIAAQLGFSAAVQEVTHTMPGTDEKLHTGECVITLALQQRRGSIDDIGHTCAGWPMTMMSDIQRGDASELQFWARGLAI